MKFWIACDYDECFLAFSAEPTWNKTSGHWQSNSGGYIELCPRATKNWLLKGKIPIPLPEECLELNVNLGCIWEVVS